VEKGGQRLEPKKLIYPSLREKKEEGDPHIFFSKTEEGRRAADLSGEEWKRGGEGGRFHLGGGGVVQKRSGFFSCYVAKGKGAASTEVVFGGKKKGIRGSGVND